MMSDNEKNVLETLEELKNTSKRTEKEAILRSVIGSPYEDLFKEVCFRTYDPNEVYYINDTDWIDPAPYVTDDNIERVFKLLDQMKKRQLSGNEAKLEINDALGHISNEGIELVTRVITGDLRCGVSKKTINKIWEGLIYDHPYHGCVSFNEKNLSNIKFPCFSQTKEDGLYIDIIVHNDRVSYMTRNGRLVNFNSSIDHDLINHSQGFVLQGEALVLNEDGTFMSREDGNGYLNSDYFDPKRIGFILWNIVRHEEFYKHKGEDDYSTSYAKLENCLAMIGSHRLKLVDTRICYNSDDIVEHFKNNVRDGLEGTIIKNFDTKWKYGRDKNMVKVKIVFEVELKVVGWKEGSGRFSGMLGSLICESSDGKLYTSVGSGFKENERKTLNGDDLINSIITVKANDIIANDKDPDKVSLFLPIFKGIRKDKNEADSLERIYEQREASINALEVIQ